MSERAGRWTTCPKCGSDNTFCTITPFPEGGYHAEQECGTCTYREANELDESTVHEWRGDMLQYQPEFAENLARWVHRRMEERRRAQPVDDGDDDRSGDDDGLQGAPVPGGGPKPRLSGAAEAPIPLSDDATEAYG